MITLFLFINALALLTIAYNAAVCMVFSAKQQDLVGALIQGLVSAFSLLLAGCWIMLMFAGLTYLLPGDFLLLGVNIVLAIWYSIIASSVKEEMGYSAPICAFVTNKVLPGIASWGDKRRTTKAISADPVAV